MTSVLLRIDEVEKEEEESTSKAETALDAMLLQERSFSLIVLAKLLLLESQKQ